MNLVYGTVVLFLFFLPGLIFRRSYLSSVFSRKILSQNILDDLFWAIIPGLFLHCVAGVIVFKLTKYEFDFQVLGTFLLGSHTKEVSCVFENIHDYFTQIANYTITVSIIALAAGNLLRQYIRQYKLDIEHRRLRFSNKWHYILSGESLLFPHIMTNEPEKGQCKCRVDDDSL